MKKTIARLAPATCRVAWLALPIFILGLAELVPQNLEAQTAATVDTNILSLLAQGYTVISPITNLPAALGNPLYFSPAQGALYVSNAIASLPQSSDRLHVGGGKIIVIGQNFYPNPLIFTNALGGIMNFDVEAPMFGGGALICATDPAIRVAGMNAGVNFEMKDLIVSTLNNGTTNLVEIGRGSVGQGRVATVDVENNWFGYWPYLTNNQDVFGLAGLETTTTGGQIGQRNLIISVDQPSTDMTKFSNDRFLGIQSVYWSPDHSDFSDNFFSYCGASAWAKAGITNTAWTTNSIYGYGAAVIFGNTSANQNQWYINNPHLYGCYDGFYSQSGITHIVHNAYFEATTLSEIGAQPILDGAFVSIGSTPAYGAPPADALNGNADSLTNIPPNLGNQDAGYVSIPAGDAFQIGDQTTANALIQSGHSPYQEDADNTSLYYGLFTNAPYFFQAAPNANGGKELDLMVAGSGDQSLGGGNQAYVPLSQIIFNPDGTITITNSLWKAIVVLKSNSVAANVPFTGSFVSFETNAANFAWSQIPPSSATVTNWWIGTFTNGLVYCIATNVASGGYLFQKVTGSISTSP